MPVGFLGMLSIRFMIEQAVAESPELARTRSQPTDKNALQG
jgi:hypothetical protein